MKLIKYEILKICYNNIMVVFFLTFLMLNLSLFLWRSTSQYQYMIDCAEEYSRMEMMYEAMPFQEAYDDLTKKAGFIENTDIIETALQYNMTEIIEDILADNPDILEQYDQMKADGTLLTNREKTVVRLIYAQAVYINGYQEYVENVQLQAEKMNTITIFNKPGTFSYRNIARTSADFEHNKGLPLMFGQSTGLVAFSKFYVTDIFVLFLMLLISARLFWYEKEKGLLVLVKSGVNGRLRMAFAKILTLFIFASAIAVIFYGMNIAAAQWLFGFGDTSRYVQSMIEFSGSNIIITVGQYLSLFLLGKIFLVCVFALMFSAAFSFFKNNAVAVLCISGIICGCYFAYRHIPYLSVFNPFKFLNPVAALNVMDVVSEYHNINLFGFPCNRINSLFITMSVLFLSFGGVVVYLYTARLNPKRQPKLFLVICDFVRKILVKFYGIYLMWHEFCKLAFSRKMILLPVLVVFFILNGIIKSEPVYSFDDDVYISYITELEGEFTVQKEEYILNKAERFNNLPAEAENIWKKLETGEITKNRYDYEMFILDEFGKRRIGFQKVWEQYNYIKALNEEGIRAGFVNEFSSDYLFNQTDRNIMSGLFWLLLTLIVSAVVFCQEYKQGMIYIINPAKNGKGKLYLCKSVIAAVFATCFMAVYIPQYVNSYNFYSLGDLSLSIRNIRMFADFPFNISIMSFIVIFHIAQWITVISALFVTVFISVKLKNQIAAIITAMVFLTVPLIIFLCGVGFAKYLPFAGAFLLDHTMRLRGDFIISVISLILTFVLGLVFLILSYLEFCNIGRQKR